VCNVNRHLNESLDEFHPDLVVYIAGTAVLCTDEAGGLCLSAQVSVILCARLPSCQGWIASRFIVIVYFFLYNADMVQITPLRRTLASFP